MKYYILFGFTNSSSFRISKKFKTRNEAINYALKLLPSCCAIEYEIEHSKHSIEYVCDNYNAFTISRQIA